MVPKQLPRRLALPAASAALLLLSVPASAQFDLCNVGAAVMCTTMGSTKTCSDDGPLVAAPTTPVLAVANNATCTTQQNSSRITFVARAMTSAPPTRTCYWTGLSQSFDRCTIDMADGLPVELMELEIVEDEGSGPEASETSASEHDRTP